MQVDCVFAFCSTVASQHRCPSGSFACTLLDFTIGGSGAMVTNAGREPFGPASALVRQAHEVYWIEQALIGDHLCLGVRGCHAEAIRPGCYPQPEGIHHLVRDLHALVRAGGAHAQQRIELLAGLVALALFERHPAQAPTGPAQRARAIIDAEFRSRLEIASVARRLHVSPAHLREQFRAAYGESPMAYLLSCRLGRAKELLKDTSIPVSQVAELSGFPDPFYFSRQFRRLIGCAPSAWRDLATVG